MWYAVTWFVVAGLLLLWTLFAWAAHAITQWIAGLSATQVTDTVGGAHDAARQMGVVQLPEWLSIWLPTAALEEWRAMAASLVPWIESALHQAPALVGWLSPVIWVVWGLGAVGLLLLGGGLSVMVRMLKGRAKTPTIT